MGCVGRVKEALEKVMKRKRLRLILRPGLRQLLLVGQMLGRLLGQLRRARIRRLTLWTALDAETPTKVDAPTKVDEQTTVDERAKVGEQTKVEEPTEVEEPREVTLLVDGMTCMGCVGRVTDALNGVYGTADVEVSPESGLVRLKFVGDESALIAAIKEGSDKVASIVDDEAPKIERPRDVTLNVEEMTCMDCVGRVTDAPDGRRARLTRERPCAQICGR